MSGSKFQHAHLVLARKYRPGNFQEVVGRNHVTQALTNALQNNRLHQAYLFEGTRGVGKTSVARILAKCLNCEEGISANPCGNCSACLEISAGVFVDLLEIDAASQTKVEDTRKILENTNYLPVVGRFKIYIIDEVHMLSNHSFNALLKTLEEPPEHIKFILATTEPQKLPATILSRCLQFNLRNVDVTKISQHLAEVLAKEQLTYEKEALNRLAYAAKGSIRDALSLVDQVIAHGNGVVTVKDVNAMLGVTDDTHVYQLVQHLAKNDAFAIFDKIVLLAEEGADFFSVLEQILLVLQQVAIWQILGKEKVKDRGNYFEQNVERIAELAVLFSKEEVQLYYQIALVGKRDLLLATNPKNGFEMVFIRMLSFKPFSSSEENLKIERENKADASANFSGEPSKSSSLVRSEKIPGESESVSSSGSFFPQNWEEILPKLELSPATRAIAERCVLEFDPINKLDLKLSISREFAVLLNDLHKSRLEDALSKFFNTKGLRVNIFVENSVQGAPYELALAKDCEDQKAAYESVVENANIAALIQELDAVVIPVSINNLKSKEEREDGKYE